MKLVLVLFFAFAGINGFTQDVNILIKDANNAELIPNEGLALYKYKEILKKYPQNIIALSKSSELCCRIGSREQSSKSKEAWYSAAVLYASKALLINPKSDIANVSMAMALGKSSMNKSGKEKIKNAKEIKKHIDIALADNSSNYLAWHILGRWNFEISTISAVERTAAKFFVGGIPHASLPDAIAHFEKARTLSKSFILNNVELARAYHENGQDDKAIKILKEVQQLPVSTEDDPALKKTAQGLIEKWK